MMEEEEEGRWRRTLRCRRRLEQINDDKTEKVQY